MIDILLPALALLIVLLGIHAWFGVEIIKRGVIFVDLAVAQTAAAGAAVSIVLFEGGESYPVSLAFALAGASLVAFVTSRERVNAEAFIGLVYAVGFAGTYLLMSRTAHGMEEFNRILAADILFTPWRETVITAILYALVGAALWWIMARASGWRRDLLFYLLFAVTVTSSVRLAGSLVVFALLIAPAFITVSCQFRRPLPWAWGIGATLGAVSLYLSYRLDLPTGYTVVFVSSAAALLVGAGLSVAKGVSLCE